LAGEIILGALGLAFGAGLGFTNPRSVLSGLAQMIGS